MRTGRPSKYDPKFSEYLIQHMREGYPFETFVAFLYERLGIRVNRDTLYEWCTKHKDFSEAKKLGRDLSYHWWMNLARAATTTGILKVRGKDGKEEHKPIVFEKTVWVFTMKNCHGWTDKTEIDQNIGFKDDFSVMAKRFAERRKKITGDRTNSPAVPARSNVTHGADPGDK